MTSTEDPFDFRGGSGGYRAEAVPPPPGTPPPRGPAGAPPVGPPPPGDPFRDFTSAVPTGRRTRTTFSMLWLLLSLAAGAVGGVWAWIAGGTPAVAIGSWALAGPLAIGLVAVYVWRNTVERARPYYVTPPLAGVLYVLTLLVAAAGIALSAWRIADWVGRL